MIIHVGFDLIVDNGQRISVSKTNKDWTEKLCFMTWREGWKEGAITCELLDCLDSNSIWFVGLNIRRITVSKIILTSSSSSSSELNLETLRV